MLVSIRDLMTQLAHYLRLAERGVTSRGRVVARLGPTGEVESTSEEDLIRELARLPWVRQGDGGGIEGSSEPMAPAGEGRPLSEILRDDGE